MSAQPPEVLVVLGTRPELIKMASTIAALRRDPRLGTRVIFTGQHTELMDDAARCLQVEADQILPSMPRGRSLTDLLGHITSTLGGCTAESRPSCLVIQGDTVSALAGALVSELQAIPLVHVEAGVRSHVRDDPFPEETIRRMISPITEMHLCFTAASKNNLIAEGHPADRVYVVPHPLIDRVSNMLDSAGGSSKVDVLVTVHRRERRQLRINRIVELIRSDRLSDVEWTLIWHPALDEFQDVRLDLVRSGVSILDPLDPATFLDKLRSSAIVLTDSAGVSEEAELLGIPLVIFRTSAEARLDAPMSCQTCVTESSEVAAEFIERHRLPSQVPLAPAQPVSAGTVIAEHVAEFALAGAGKI